MRKFTIILSLLLMTSCDKTDVEYVINLTAVCPNGGEHISHCVTQDTYDRMMDQVEAMGLGCKRLTFVDINGAGVAGYYVGGRQTVDACN